MLLRTLFVILSTSIMLLGCDEIKNTDTPDIEKDITTFTLSPDTIKQNESFTINMIVKIRFDVDIRIREKGTSTEGRSIYYSTYQQDYLQTLIFDYSNEKITMKNTVTNVSVKPGQYELFIRLCDINGTGFSCVDGSPIYITFLAEDALLIDFGYYLQTANEKLFSKSSVTKILPIQNISDIAKNYSVQLNTPNPTNPEFNYSFRNHGLGVFSIAPHSYDNLTISTNSATLNLKDNYTAQEKFKVAVDNKSKEYTSRVTVMKVAEESCSNAGENPCNGSIIFTISNEKPLAGVLFDNDVLSYLKSINATVQFDSDFFDKFQNDNRTTCSINESGNGTLTLDYSKECFLFLRKKLGGEAFITITGYESSNPNNQSTPITKKLKFTTN